jgi:hypothetical protein
MARAARCGTAAAIAVVGLLLATHAAPSAAGPVEVYREGPAYCPRDRSRDAPPIGEREAIERARTLLPRDFCGPTLFVSGCDFEPEFALSAWRVYVHQYRQRGTMRDRGGLDHTYVILDTVGNCIANIPGT